MKIHLKQKSARIELIPLIDIVFLLLVFFIYSMLSMVVYRGIPVVLPNAQTVEKEKGKPLHITIDEKGNIFVDKVLIARDMLLGCLKRERADYPQKIAIISGDRDSRYRVFVDVLDKVRLAGFQRISMEAMPQTTED